MARTSRRSDSKPNQEPARRVKTSIHFDPEVLKLLKLGAIETGLDMSELVNLLVKEKFAGYHIRKGRGEGALISQPASEPATVRINTPLNRISEIHNRSAAPVDHALDTITDDD